MGVGMFLSNKFVERLDNGIVKVEQYLSRVEDSGHKHNLGILEEFILKNTNNLNLTLGNYYGILTKIMKRPVNRFEVLCFVKYFSKCYSMTVMKEIFIDHPNRYKIFKEIYKLLEESGTLTEKDKFDLIVGRGKVHNDYNLRLVEEKEDHYVCVSDNYEFLVSKDLSDKGFSYKYMDSILNKKFEDNLLELYYVNRGIIVRKTIEIRRCGLY